MLWTDHLQQRQQKRWQTYEELLTLQLSNSSEGHSNSTLYFSHWQRLRGGGMPGAGVGKGGPVTAAWWGHITEALRNINTPVSAEWVPHSEHF